MKLSTPLLDLYSNPVKSGQKSRVYIVVGVAVSKKAVDRNLIKRRIRAVLRDLSMDGSIRVIKIIAKPAILGAKFPEIKRAIEAGWSKI